MPLFVGDYEADTAHLTIEEDGAYMRLLRLCWRTPGCSIPHDPAWIARRLRVDADTFDRLVAPLIGEFFRVEKGRVFSPRLTSEYERVATTFEKRSEAGRKGGRPTKRLKTDENSESRDKSGRKPGESNQNQNQNTDNNPPTPHRGEHPRFADFWDAFADKRGRPNAAKAFKAACKRADPEEIISGARRYAARRGPEQRFGKMAQGWLNDDRWTVEAAPQRDAYEDHLKSWGIPDADPSRAGGGTWDTHAAKRDDEADVSRVLPFPKAAEPARSMPVGDDDDGWAGDFLPPLRSGEGRPL